MSPTQYRFRRLILATRQVAYAQNREWRLLRRALYMAVSSVYPHMRPSTFHPVPRSCLRLLKVHIVRPSPRYDGRITCPCVKPYGISAQTGKAQASRSVVCGLSAFRSVRDGRRSVANPLAQVANPLAQIDTSRHGALLAKVPHGCIDSARLRRRIDECRVSSISNKIEPVLYGE